MPLSPAAPRKHLHSRDIRCRGYEREDGLWDIEAELIDTKTYSFDNHDRGGIQAGEPVHHMRVRLTVDETMTIRHAEAATEASPFGICDRITPAFSGLEGLEIGPGWRKRVIALFGREKGCTHLTDLLTGPLATTALQTIAAARAKRFGNDGSKPALIDSCHAFAEDGPVVARLWPEHAKAPTKDDNR